MKSAYLELPDAGGLLFLTTPVAYLSQIPSSVWGGEILYRTDGGNRYILAISGPGGKLNFPIRSSDLFSSDVQEKMKPFQYDPMNGYLSGSDVLFYGDLTQ